MTAEPAKPRRSLLRRLLRFIWIVLLAIFVLASAGWAAMAVNFSNLPWSWLRQGAAVAFLIATIVILWRLRPWRKALLAYLGLFAVVLVWYYLIPPSNNRDWQPDVARTPTVTIVGDEITVHNVRNFTYRSETDYDEHWEDRTYNRSKLKAGDLIMSFWGPTAICHTFISFVFDDGKTMCISIETRKEKGEGYSAVRGMFRLYELVYIIADERDLIGLRTDHRHEEVYLYRLRLEPKRLRDIFDDYLKGANELAANPTWYNALTDSCSIGIVYHSWASQGHRPFRIRYLLNGYWDEYLYADNGIYSGAPFAQVKAASHINQRASAVKPGEDFSKAIRAGLPGM